MKILIFKCLKDDNDGEMSKMADSLAKAKIAKKHEVKILDFSNYTDKKSIKPQDKFEEVYFCGHFRYFEKSTNFYQPPSKWVIRKMGDRKLGGYTCDEVVDVIVDCVNKRGVQKVILFSCETAVTVESYKLTNKKYEQFWNLNSTRMGRVRTSIKLNHHHKVSFLQQVALKVQSQIKNKPLYLCGMNGVGLISQKDDTILTFSQEHLYIYNKKSTKPDEFEEKYALTKKSPHIIGYKLNSV